MDHLPEQLCPILKGNQLTGRITRNRTCTSRPGHLCLRRPLVILSRDRRSSSPKLSSANWHRRPRNNNQHCRHLTVNNPNSSSSSLSNPSRGTLSLRRRHRNRPYHPLPATGIPTDSIGSLSCIRIMAVDRGRSCSRVAGAERRFPPTIWILL